MKFYIWTQEENPTYGFLRLDLPANITQWDLIQGKLLESPPELTPAIWEDGDVLPDFPFTDEDLPVYSPHLRALITSEGINSLQYLPLAIKKDRKSTEYAGYSLVNYLAIVDCLDRVHSSYQIWTKENLLFWEKRPWMLGGLRDVNHTVLDSTRIGNNRLFRLAGWEVMAIVRGDLKEALENAGMTGCRFSEIEVI